MLIYPSIFAFPLLPLHCWSTTTHLCTDATTHDNTHTCFIGPISLIWWTHVLQFTCFISILSIPNMHWWASSSDMLIYPSIFTFLYIVDPPLCTSTPTWLHTLTWQSHSLHRTDLTYLMDTWFTIHMYLLLFLVSPMCPLLQSNQSWALTPHGQALSITSPYAHFLVFHSYLTCLYLPFAHIIIREEPHNCLYQFPPELRFSTYASHCLTPILHRTASQSHCLYLIPHLETIPYPQITPSEPHRIYT